MARSLLIQLYGQVHPKSLLPALPAQPVLGAASAARKWIPTDLGSKLLFWLHASSLSGADASNITTWTDLSGLGNNGTGNSVGGTARPILKTSLGPSGGNAVRLSGSSGTGDFFDMPTALLSGTSGVNGAALYGLYKQTTNPPTGTPGGVFGDFGTDALANHDPFTDNTFYEDGLRTARVTTTLTSTSDWQLLGIRSKTNDWRISLNAALDNGSNTSTYYSTTTSTFGANTVPRIGSSGSNANFIDGLLYNLVGTSDFLTTAEKEQLEGYILWDAGRQDLLPATHTYKSQAPTVSTAVTSSTGIGASTEDADATAASGTAAIAITGASTETADTTAASGAVSIAASGASTEGTDSTSASGTVSASASGASTEGTDTTAGAATATARATGASTESTDTTSASGTVAVAASGGSTEGTDTTAGVGTASVSASGASTESSDTGTGVGAVNATASGASAEGTDGTAAAGAVSVSGSGSDSETTDTSSGAGAAAVAASGASAEGTDNCSGSGTVLSITFGRVKLWIGTSFITKPVKAWNGSAWLERPLKRWDGAHWTATG